MTDTLAQSGGDVYGPPRISIELTDICNLHCSYCLRDEEALYGHAANFFSLTLLERVLLEATETLGITNLIFTGGEPSLHPKFSEVLALAKAHGVKVSFVTNGWNFEKLWPLLLEHRETIDHIAFSIDGITVAEHDKWRGQGSFVRLIRAFSRCHKAKLPFVLKIGIRRDTMDQLEQIAMFAARVGASVLSFSHLLPTSAQLDAQSALSLEERTTAEKEIATLAGIFRMKIGIDVGYYNIDTHAPCSPLKGTSCNIDYRGRLTLCCNLSGFRGATNDQDVAADLNVESFSAAHARLREIARQQMERRAQAIENFTLAGQQPDLFTGSPCLLCLQNFGKIPWREASLPAKSAGRSLPVMHGAG
jgi:MoaA/NifB/PqqE/SkfB family radical SAM enzyme